MMGLGQAPIVPIAFSRAGAIKGVSTARATSLVSLLAYAGLLFAPPAFGLRPNTSVCTPHFAPYRFCSHSCSD